MYILIIKISDMPVRVNMFWSRVRNLGNNLEIDYFVQLGLHESDNKPAEGALYLLRISLENSLNIKNRCNIWPFHNVEDPILISPLD